jgi:transcriptional regulator with XRE-family HTH domain
MILARKRLQLTQQEAADLIGIPRSMYAKYEIGLRTPRVTRAQAIARALKTDINNIFKEAE